MRTHATALIALLSFGLIACQGDEQVGSQEDVSEVQYYGGDGSPISSAVEIPKGRTLFWTSGTVPPVTDESAPEGSKARYGDMETQATGVLQRIEDNLKEEGLSMNDVVFLKVYLVPDEDGSVNFEGWSAAYGKFFGTEETPTKPARSTMAVYQLFSPAWRVEVEALAARPE